MEAGMLGVNLVDGVDRKESAFADMDMTPEEWRVSHEASLHNILNFLSCRDPIEILAKTASYQQVCSAMRSDGLSSASNLEEADVEVLQAISLHVLHGRKNVPTSPNNMSRLWENLAFNVFSHLAMQPEKYSEESAYKEYVVRKIRSQTVYYRRNYQAQDCERMVRGIFSPLSELSDREIGLNIETAYELLLCIYKVVQVRYEIFFKETRNLLKATNTLELHSANMFFANCSPLGTWLTRRSSAKSDLLAEKMRLFQISEMTHSWIYSFSITDLPASIRKDAETILDTLSYKIGESPEQPIGRVYMDNPVWTRPLIKTGSNSYFLPNPGIIYSFPVLILENFIKKSKTLLKRLAIYQFR